MTNNLKKKIKKNCKLHNRNAKIWVKKVENQSLARRHITVTYCPTLMEIFWSFLKKNAKLLGVEILKIIQLYLETMQSLRTSCPTLEAVSRLVRLDKPQKRKTIKNILKKMQVLEKKIAKICHIKKTKSILCQIKCFPKLIIKRLRKLFSPCVSKDVNNEENAKKIEKICTFCQKIAKIVDVNTLKPLHYQ